MGDPATRYLERSTAPPKPGQTRPAYASLVWAADEAGGYGRPILNDIHPLTTGEGGAAAYAVTCHAPDGPGATAIRSVFRGAMSGLLNAGVLVDHRALGGQGCMYAGALTNEDTAWDPATGVNRTAMVNLAEEDTWDQRWIEVMKQGSNPPVVQAPTARSAQLANGVTLNTISFVTRQGMTPNEFFLFEPKMPTVMNAAPFVAVALTGYPGDGKRPGERHPQRSPSSGPTSPSRPNRTTWHRHPARTHRSGCWPAGSTKRSRPPGSPTARRWSAPSA